MKKKVCRLLFLTLCVPSFIAAADTSTGMIHFWQETQLASSQMRERSESTLYFNDGFGRLTEFHMTQVQHVMTLVIRQNMNVVWQGRTEVDTSRFSVTREEREGQVYFRITMGNKEYKASLHGSDQWNVVEIKEAGEWGETIGKPYPI